MLSWYLNALEIMILMFVLTNYGHSDTIRVAKLASCISKNLKLQFFGNLCLSIYIFIILTIKSIIFEVKMSLLLQYVIGDYIKFNIYIK